MAAHSPMYEPPGFSGNVGETFLRAEQTGLRIAIIGRTIALVLLGVWLVGTRARDPERALDYLLLLSVFAALGLVDRLEVLPAGPNEPSPDRAAG